MRNIQYVRQNPNVFQAVVDEMKGKAPAAMSSEVSSSDSRQMKAYGVFSTRPLFYPEAQGEFMAETRHLGR